MKKTGRRKGLESIRVYESLRDQLVSGKLGPGTRLSQHVLAQSMGTSNGPVISALRRLTHEGLVKHVRGHGCKVTDWSDQELEDKLVIRRALETEAARLLATESKSKDIARLQKMVEGMAELVRKEKREEAGAADVKFHMAIASMTGSPSLQEALERCHLLEVVRRRLKTNDAFGDFQNLVENHQLLVDAIASGNPDLAGKTMHYHLLPRRVKQALKGS